MSTRALRTLLLAVGGTVVAWNVTGRSADTVLHSLKSVHGSVQRSGAVAALRAVQMAQQNYAMACGQSFYAPSLEALGRPPAEGGEPFLERDLGKAGEVVRAGFVYRMRTTPAPGAPAACNGVPAGEAAQTYVVVAEPVDGTSGPFYAMNTNGMIYQHTSSLARAMPENGLPAVGELAK
jgi:hypothetical protein